MPGSVPPGYPGHAGSARLASGLHVVLEAGHRKAPRLDAPQEVAEAQEAISLLGGRVAQLTPVELPTVAETRYLVDIAKVAATPPAYPRRAGRPTKRPL